ncbi:hypothetical protein MIND_00692500 [Mycena indigotica]|uniref:Uncharacterized protein n=1 Tax=Mycena indigotica TaxID=2126181 RepID=A0A8H6W186_9AGAR|nr:uncharacterized protein MIND_00692500 [Mycena indigotica]KAF7301277.1 hypothetical protein MIND_00692500 [Mycena indigotica]
MSNPTIPSSEAELKHLEKSLRKESKDEAKQVKHILHDVSHAEKTASKAEKVDPVARASPLLADPNDQAFNKAEKQNEKLGRNEASAADALNKATHEHNRAVNELETSERDVKLKQQQDVKLHAELEKKKTHAEQLMEGQRIHEAAREAKLNEIKEARGAV